jgi:4a-hydroxytetrahydrobiopterin dehydratase
MLSKETCEACRADAPLLTEAEIAALMPEVDGWDVINEESQQRLQRVFGFKNFEQAMSAAQKVGEYADQVGHHPRLVVEWGSLVVTWWSHKIGGLHRNDFICAARTSELVDKE